MTHVEYIAVYIPGDSEVAINSQFLLLSHSSGEGSERTGNKMRGYLVLLIGLAALTQGSATNQSLIDIASLTCLYSNFCTRDAFLTVPEGSDKASCCYPCSCSEDCLEFNNCCPDYEPPNNQPDNPKTIPCKQANYRGNTEGRFYYIIDECPDDFTNTVTNSKCLGATLDTLNDIAIVWSPSKRKIYQNRFCASCHGANDLIAWQPFLKYCNTTSYSTHLTDVLANQAEDCEMFFEPSSYSAVFDDLACFDTENMIDNCSAQVGTDPYGTSLKGACESGARIPYVVPGFLSRLLRFKNVFCYVCNPQMKPTISAELCDGMTNRKTFISKTNDWVIPVTIMLELQLRQRDTARPLTCASDEMYDSFTEKCRRIHCQFLDVAVDGDCVTQVVATTGLPVTIHFKVIPSRLLSLHYTDAGSDNLKENILRKVVERIWETLNDQIAKGCGQCAAYVYIATAPTTNIVEEFFIDVTLFTTVSCSDFDIRKRRHTLLKENTLSLRIDNIEFDFRTYVVLEKHNFSDPKKIFLKKMCPHFHLPSKDTHYCSYVELNAIDYTMALRNNILKNNDEVCPSNSLDDPSCNNATIKRVCLSDYNPIPTKIPSQMKPTDPWNISGIVSLVCTVISTLSLLALIFTYNCFKSLRKFPSGTILILSINLLLSQLLYVFGLGRTEIHWLCFGFGVAIHYFVLSYVFTMSSYMIFVYTTLCSEHLQNIRKKVFVMVLYIYIFPLVFISVNVGVALHTSVGRSFGYGGEYCFISSADMRRYVFAVPIFLAVCCNCCLYGFTVKQIHSVTENLPSDIQARRSNQWIYLRLSMLTGISWLFGFIHEVSGDPISEYCFIVFNAGQGIFLMVCFVCKRSIYELYKQSFVSE